MIMVEAAFGADFDDPEGFTTAGSSKPFGIMVDGWRGRWMGRRVPWLLVFLRSWHAFVTGDACSWSAVGRG